MVCQGAMAITPIPLSVLGKDGIFISLFHVDCSAVRKMVRVTR